MDTEVDFAYAIGAYRSKHTTKGVVPFTIGQCDITLTPPPPGVVPTPDMEAQRPAMLETCSTAVWQRASSAGDAATVFYQEHRNTGDRNESTVVFYVTYTIPTAQANAAKYWMGLGISSASAPGMATMNMMVTDTATPSGYVAALSTEQSTPPTLGAPPTTKMSGSMKVEKGQLQAVFYRPSRVEGSGLFDLADLEQTAGPLNLRFAVGTGDFGGAVHYETGVFAGVMTLSTGCGEVYGAAPTPVDSDDDDAFPLWLIIVICAGGAVCLAAIGGVLYWRGGQTKKVGFNQFMYDMDDLDAGTGAPQKQEALLE